MLFSFQFVKPSDLVCDGVKYDRKHSNAQKSHVHEIETEDGVQQLFSGKKGLNPNGFKLYHIKTANAFASVISKIATSLCSHRQVKYCKSSN